MFANSLAILGNRRFKARKLRKYVNANASSYDFHIVHHGLQVAFSAFQHYHGNQCKSSAGGGESC